MGHSEIRDPNCPESVRVFIYLTHPVPKISTQHSPIANLEHPFALNVSDNQALSGCLGKWSPDDSVIANAQCKRMFQIGDRRMLSADFGNWMRQVYECLTEEGNFSNRFRLDPLPVQL